ncbi:hypothetical protein BT69DRAFT_1342614 [Atractiella rhizophila]|nr:hypothetical protein BT69DRAFT_1342614 [Atractiella rhizophila]
MKIRAAATSHALCRGTSSSHQTEAEIERRKGSLGQPLDEERAVGNKAATDTANFGGAATASSTATVAICQPQLTSQTQPTRARGSGSPKAEVEVKVRVRDLTVILVYSHDSGTPACSTPDSTTDEDDHLDAPPFYLDFPVSIFSRTYEPNSPALSVAPNCPFSPLNPLCPPLPSRHLSLKLDLAYSTTLFQPYNLSS